MERLDKDYIAKTDILILKSLYYGNHLSEKEKERASYLISALKKELLGRV